jgi:hypothetical protein
MKLIITLCLAVLLVFLNVETKSQTLTSTDKARYDAVKTAVGDSPVTEDDIRSGYDPQLIARSYARFGHGVAENPDSSATVVG